MSAQPAVLYVQGDDDATRHALADREDLLVFGPDYPRPDDAVEPNTALP